MKATSFARLLAKPDLAIRCYLFYGADESGSRDLASRLAVALGNDVERRDLTPAELKSDPALLADEAASTSLFGGRRYIRVDGANDDCFAAVEALMAASAAGNPVILVAGALRKDARLLKRIDRDAAAVAVVSYVPEGADAERLAVALGKTAGLSLDGDVARRLIGAAGGDRAVLAGELEKLALYLDATPERPVRVDAATIEAIGASSEESDVAEAVAAVFSGDVRALDRALSCLGADEAVPLLRAMLRRVLVMAAARAEMGGGSSATPVIAKAGRSLFFKDRDAVARDLAHWSAAQLETATMRLAQLEREIKSSRGAGLLAARQSLLTMARGARRR